MMKSRIKKIVKGISKTGNNKNIQTEKLLPFDISPVLDYDHLNTKEEINNWIKEGINCFREWYQPIDFGDGIIANVTRPPDWKSSPEFNAERGVSKWNKIVKRNLPNLAGKRILDLGCNNGIFSILMAKEGAKEVIGIDRDETIHQKTYSELPAQNIIEQANFVKRAFELKEKINYPIRYIPADISMIDKLQLGNFDIILALCVVYHEMSGMPSLINTLGKMTNHLVLQTSLTHEGELASWADLYTQVKYLHQAGFDKITIDAPVGYHLPMIIGEK